MGRLRPGQEGHCTQPEETRRLEGPAVSVRGKRQQRAKPSVAQARLPGVFFCLLILVWGKKKTFSLWCSEEAHPGQEKGGSSLGLSLLFLQNPSPQRQQAVQPTHRVGAGAPLTSLDLGPAVAAGQTGGLQRWGGLWVCMCPSLGLAPAQPVTAVARRPGFVINRSFNCYRAGGGRREKKGGKDLLDLGGAGCREKRHCFCEGAWSC